ncbi:XdhC family protein [Paenibacillus amylolyticus]|jgi:xanthine dehydrogenase accessory factor|uniref:XdhC family protein n=1 Tax=Paenibacillus amylolyticus TaxID=1451 RepID=A0A5M9WYS8_PAEAM|nr:XdhC/CoxI family protein [Paenibacillus amylolyticus]KAA8786824.1 XdhC family protein [Paenibacillus amylolyticus]
MEMHDLCAIALRETRSVLATAIKVEGHAYRKQGVSMLITEDGRMYGSISPGCLESDLQARVSRVLEMQQLELASYDMRPEDDLSWGETIGCGGLVVVLLEPISGELRDMMKQIQRCLDAALTVSLLRSFDEDYTKVTYGYLKIESVASGQEQYLTANEQAECSKKVLSSHPLNLKVGINPWNLPQHFTSLYTPKPRLIIVGAGNDVVPVAGLSQSAGFRVVITDWRASLCTPERFPDVERVHGFPQEVFPQLNINEHDYLMLMSHQFPREREWLALLANSNYAYLGIMGSRTRTARLFDGLPPLDHVHSPIGLSIGADGPEEIAISIVAELIAIRRKTVAGKSALGIEKRSGAYANDRYRSSGWQEQQTWAR